MMDVSIRKELDVSTKKELDAEEYDQIMTSCKTFIGEHTIEDSLVFCKEKIKEIIPANYVEILISSSSSDEIVLSSFDQKFMIKASMEEESSVLQAYKTKQPLILNDVSRSFLYNPKFDNYNDFPVKNLLLVPLVDRRGEKEVLAIIYAVVSKGNFNQYTQNDLDYMIKFSILMRRLFGENRACIEHNGNSDNESKDYMFAYEGLMQKSKRDHTYFSSIIHDVRTPMNAVLGYLELLLLKKQDTGDREYIEAALKSGEMMVALINDALDLSKITSGKMDVEKIIFSPFKEFADVEKLFFNTAKKEEVNFYTYFDPMLPKEINSDYHRIKQIINNLLSNALKFTPKDGKITLDLLYDKSKDALMVSIKDTGIGIAKDRQSAIFSAYAQENTSTSREYGGTGLGLNISQQLAVLLGGNLKVESEEGKGSRFFFAIPCDTQKYDTAFDLKKLSEQKIVFASFLENYEDDNALVRYLDHFIPECEKISDVEKFLDPQKVSFDLLIILQRESIKYQKEVQNLLDAKKSVLVICDIFINGECIFEGNVKRLSPPILPNELYDALVELSMPDKVKESTKLSSDNDIEQIKAKHLSALVVDDSLINLKFMGELLKVMGVSAKLAKDGIEAIEMSEKGGIDIVFMDATMPVMNGNDAVIQMRSDEKKSKVPKKVIIGLSGDVTVESKETFMASGVDMVLTKPIHLQEIIDTILKYFKK